MLLIFASTTLYAARERTPPALLGTDPSSILLTWTSGDLEASFVTGAAGLKEVKAVSAVRNGIGWLTWWSAAGGPPANPRSGFKVPLEIAAVDPAAYSAFLPARHKELFARLAEGGALLSRSGAALRGIDNQGSLQFDDLAVPVIGVVDDNLIASHEAIISYSTAGALGIVDPKYLLIAPAEGTSQKQIEAALEPLVPPGQRLGMRTSNEAPILRPGGTVLSQAQMKAVFGEFAARPARGAAITIDPDWVGANTENVRIPLLGLTRCHRKIVPAVQSAFQEISSAGLETLVETNQFGGCFAPRRLSADPHSGLSRHAWGAAFDFNVPGNLLGEPPTMDRRLVEILKRWGFAWGGDWMTPDGMHFEYLQEPEEG
ncbi:MAG: M15 family metallopeptidase [Actinomycetota bacterium]